MKLSDILSENFSLSDFIEQKSRANLKKQLVVTNSSLFTFVKFLYESRVALLPAEWRQGEVVVTDDRIYCKCKDKPSYDSGKNLGIKLEELGYTFSNIHLTIDKTYNRIEGGKFHGLYIAHCTEEWVHEDNSLIKIHIYYSENGVPIHIQAKKYFSNGTVEIISLYGNQEIIGNSKVVENLLKTFLQQKESEYLTAIGNANKIEGQLCILLTKCLAKIKDTKLIQSFTATAKKFYSAIDKINKLEHRVQDLRGKIITGLEMDIQSLHSASTFTGSKQSKDKGTVKEKHNEEIEDADDQQEIDILVGEIKSNITIRPPQSTEEKTFLLQQLEIHKTQVEEGFLNDIKHAPSLLKRINRDLLLLCVKCAENQLTPQNKSLILFLQTQVIKTDNTLYDKFKQACLEGDVTLVTQIFDRVQHKIDPALCMEILKIHVDEDFRPTKSGSDCTKINKNKNLTEIMKFLYDNSAVYKSAATKYVKSDMQTMGLCCVRPLIPEVSQEKQYISTLLRLAYQKNFPLFETMLHHGVGEHSIGIFLHNGTRVIPILPALFAHGVDMKYIMALTERGATISNNTVCEFFWKPSADDPNITSENAELAKKSIVSCGVLHSHDRAATQRHRLQMQLQQRQLERGAVVIKTNKDIFDNVRYRNFNLPLYTFIVGRDQRKSDNDISKEHVKFFEEFLIEQSCFVKIVVSFSLLAHKYLDFSPHEGILKKKETLVGTHNENNIFQMIEMLYKKCIKMIRNENKIDDIVKYLSSTKTEIDQVTEQDLGLILYDKKILLSAYNDSLLLLNIQKSLSFCELPDGSFIEEGISIVPLYQEEYQRRSVSRLR